MISMDSSTSCVSLRIVHMQSTAASNDASTESACTTASKRGELTTSAAGISRSHDEIHSSRCGFDAALAGLRSVLEDAGSLTCNLPDDWEYWVRSLRT